MREYLTLHRSVFCSYLTIESGRIHDIGIVACQECLMIVHKMDSPVACACSIEIQTILCLTLDNTENITHQLPKVLLNLSSHLSHHTTEMCYIDIQSRGHLEGSAGATS